MSGEPPRSPRPVEDLDPYLTQRSLGHEFALRRHLNRFSHFARRTDTQTTQRTRV